MCPVTGYLLLSDTNSRQIYRVGAAGGAAGGRQRLKDAPVVAGTGEQCVPFNDAHCGDGGQATQAALMSPRGEGVGGHENQG